MGFLASIFSKATGGIIESTGEAITKVVRVSRGDETQREAGRQAIDAAIADEQLAVLAQHATEFVSRQDRTWWDSLWDGINRAPRPLVVFYVLGVMVWPFFSPESFMRYALSLELLPDEMYQLFLLVLSLYFGSRVLSSDLKPPRMTPEQKNQALEIIREREKAIIEARTPLVVEVAPTPKPPPPAWAVAVLNKKPSLPPVPAPSTAPEPGQRPEFVDKMVAEIIRKEGGAKYTNDPSDSGGPTKFGVTLTTLSEWRERECTADDVKNLGRAEAEDIYRTKFYYGPSIDTLPLGLQHHVFDCAINMGPRGAVRLLQKSLNALGSGLKEDGVIGPATRNACTLYDEKLIHNTLVDHRIAFYKDLAARRPKDKRFLNGWLKRAETFRV